MYGKASFIFLATLLLFASADAVVGQQSAVTLDRQIKARVNDLGAGAKVTVFLKDGTKVRGSISQILDDSFDVTIKNETQSSIISFRDVQRIKKRGLTTGAKIGIGVAIGAGAIVTALVVIISGSEALFPSGP